MVRSMLTAAILRQASAAARRQAPNISIIGGYIRAEVGHDGAGIGGGDKGEAENLIRINGPTPDAQLRVGHAQYGVLEGCA